jgi:hypothetical protein
MSSKKVVDGFEVVEGRVTRMHLYCCASRSEVTLFQTSGVCHDPGTKMSVGLEDIVKRLKVQEEGSQSLFNFQRLKRRIWVRRNAGGCEVTKLKSLQINIYF